MAKRKEIVPQARLSWLQEMIAELQSDRPITDEWREQILDAIECFYLNLVCLQHDHTPGRRINLAVWVHAAVMREVIRRTNCKVKEAVWAVAPNAKPSTYELLQRTYRKLKAKPDDFTRVSPELVEKAIQRLSKIGNK